MSDIKQTKPNKVSYLDSHMYKTAPEMFELLNYTYNGADLDFSYLNNEIGLDTLRAMLDKDNPLSGIEFVRDSQAILWVPHPKQLRGENWFKKLKNDNYKGRKILLLVDTTNNEYVNLADESSDVFFEYFKGQIHENLSNELEKIFPK